MKDRNEFHQKVLDIKYLYDSDDDMCRVLLNTLNGRDNEIASHFMLNYETYHPIETIYTNNQINDYLCKN